MSAEQAIESDCKAYDEAGRRFSVAQIEELSFAHFTEKADALLEALERHRSREALLFAALLVTDITDQNSMLLVRGAEEFLRTIDYPPHGPHMWELRGVVSRKKQLVPYLLGCLERMS
jgi:manganese-dependent inorganic pyrophosphatase